MKPLLIVFDNAISSSHTIQLYDKQDSEELWFWFFLFLKWFCFPSKIILHIFVIKILHVLMEFNSILFIYECACIRAYLQNFGRWLYYVPLEKLHNFAWKSRDVLFYTIFLKLNIYAFMQKFFFVVVIILKVFFKN